MPRIRTIKPEFWTSERLGTRLPGPDGRHARLLFVALWNHAEDRTGVLRGNTAFLRGAVFPYDDDVTPADLERWLRMLEAGGFIVRYERDGSRYIWVRGFVEHQRIDRPSAPTLPEPSEQERHPVREPRQSVQIPESRARRGLDEGSLQEGKGREGSGEEVGSLAASQGAADAGPPADDLPDATEDALPDDSGQASMFPASAPKAQEPKKRERTPSSQETLYARMEGAREETCRAHGQPYVSEAWSYGRQNKELKAVVDGPPEEQRTFLDAFLAYLEDEKKGSARVPWSISLFMQGGVRAEYVTRVLRERGAA